MGDILHELGDGEKRWAASEALMIPTLPHSQQKANTNGGVGGWGMKDMMVMGKKKA